MIGITEGFIAKTFPKSHGLQSVLRTFMLGGGLTHHMAISILYKYMYQYNCICLVIKAFDIFDALCLVSVDASH